MSYSNSDDLGRPEPHHPSYLSELGCRLDTIISLYSTKKEAANIAGVSPDQLMRYVNGKNAPGFEVLSRLVAPKGISLDWLATGSGEMYLAQRHPEPDREEKTTVAEPDEDMAALIADGVSRVYKEAGARLSPGDLGRITARLYADAMRFGAATQRPAFVAGALGMLRRDLQKPINTETDSKRLA